MPRIRISSRIEVMPLLLFFLIMKKKKYYVQPDVMVVDSEIQSILTGSGDWDGTPGAETDPMPEEE